MAGKSLGTLTLDLLVKTGSFIEGFSKAERESKRFKQNLERNLNGAAKAFAGLVAGATVATAALIKTSVDTAAAMDDVAQTTGIAVEELSALKYAADFEGVGFDDLSKSVGTLAKNVLAAAKGAGTGAEAFKELGIGVYDTEGRLKTMDQLLLEVADRFADMEDGVVKSNYATALFGKQGAALIPFLNKGAEGIRELTDEAERFGLVISGDTARLADDFNSNLYRFRAVVQGTGVQLATALLPRLVEFSDIINDPETQENIKAIVTGIADIAIMAAKGANELVNFSRWLGEATAAKFGGAAIGDLVRLNDQLEEVNRQIAQIELLDSQVGHEARLAALNAEKVKLEEMLALTEELYKPPPVPRSFVGPPLPDGFGKDTPDPLDTSAADRLADEIQRRMEDYQREAALIGEVTELERVRYEMQHGALKGIDDASRVTLEMLAAEIDANTQLAAAAEERIKQQDAQQQALEEFDKLAEGLERERDLYGEVSRAEAMRFEIASGNLTHLTAEQARYLLLLSEELDALDAAARAEKERAEELKKQEKVFEEFGLQAARNIQDALVDAFMGVESNWSETLNRMALELATSQLLKTAATALAGSDSKGLAAIGSFFAGAFATGGMIPAGQFGLVGEEGPEFVTGPAFVTGQKKTQDLLQSGRGDNYFNFSMPGITNANEASRAGAAIQRSVRAAVQQAGRYD
jgi:hypothetical protein